MFPTWLTLRMRMSLVWTSLNSLVFMLVLTPELISQVRTRLKEIFGNSGKSEKKEIPQKVLPFFQKFSTRMNRSIWIRPGITENSTQMVRAPRVLVYMYHYLNGEFIVWQTVYDIILTVPISGVYCLVSFLECFNTPCYWPFKRHFQLLKNRKYHHFHANIHYSVITNLLHTRIESETPSITTTD